MYHKPSQMTVFLWYLFGLLTLCAAIYILPAAWQIALVLVGAGLFSLYRAAFFQMDIDAAIREEHALIKAELADPNLRLLRALGQLSPAQVELIKSNAVAIQLTPAPNGPAQVYTLPGAMPGKNTITHETLARFISLSSEQFTAPLREFADGIERQEVYNLMDWLSFQGHIQRQPSGRYPAAWQPGAYFTVSKMFGYSVKAEELCQKQTR